jgi:hypothetical protein
MISCRLHENILIITYLHRWQLYAGKADTDVTRFTVVTEKEGKKIKIGKGYIERRNVVKTQKIILPLNANGPFN